MTQTAQKLHFISGLPRSGSTLLAGILRQNPRFQAGMSSPVGSLVTGLLAQVSAGSEFSAQVSNAQRKRLMRGLFDNYYADQQGKEVIFDTNRLWCSKLPLVLDLFPNAKVIACVRNVAWVMDSIEKIVRANPYENTRLFSGAPRSTIYSRLELLAQHEHLVGFPWSALRDAFYSPEAKSLLLVDYDLLTKAPAKVISLIYEFLGEPAFAHDFDNVDYEAPEFDLPLGVPTLHKVAPKVEHRTRRTLLPPDLFEKYAQMSFWTDTNGSAAHVIAAPAEKTNATTGAEK
ncbi:MAG: sulfotransferase [Proteobacteria bacterium]|nr:sulfotransferase [Pseudomonadota bacterium]